MLGHKIGAPSDIIAFRILNPADKGRYNSRALADVVVAWDLGQPEAMLKFTQAILEHEKKNHTVTKVGESVINTRNEKLGDTPYETRDCYLTAKPFGIHVRLGIEKLPKTTNEWSDKLETDFKNLLESITVKASK